MPVESLSSLFHHLFIPLWGQKPLHQCPVPVGELVEASEQDPGVRLRRQLISLSPCSQDRFPAPASAPALVVVLLFLDGKVLLKCLFLPLLRVLVVLCFVQEWLQSCVRYAHVVTSLVSLGVIGEV